MLTIFLTVIHLILYICLGGVWYHIYNLRCHSQSRIHTTRSYSYYRSHRGLANYNGNRSDLVADITQRERELWDNARQREHAARLQAEALRPTAA